MTIRSLIIICTLTALVSGCAHNQAAMPSNISTGQHSPVRLHKLDWPEQTELAERPDDLKKILLLPPLGVGDPDTLRKFQQQLYSAAQRHFYTPINMILTDSAYAPYVSQKNLIFNDGTVNVEEIAFIGTLMKSSHIICPYIRELKPYHPQRIDIRLMLIEADSGTICAELTSVIDARDSDIRDYFIEYCMQQKSDQEQTDSLHFKIQSPDTFQAFVTDMCSSVLAKELSL